MNALVLPTLSKHACSQVHVIYTSPEATGAALELASSLSRNLELGIHVLAFQVVPHRLSMTEPPVSQDFAVNEILRNLAPYAVSKLTVEYVLCRDAKETSLRWLRKPAVVILGGRTSLIPSKEQRLARYLKAHGCDVIFVPYR